MFQFYTVAILPFMLLALTFALRDIAGPRHADRYRRTSGQRIVLVFLVVAVALSAFWYPILTGDAGAVLLLAGAQLDGGLDLTRQTVELGRVGDRQAAGEVPAVVGRRARRPARSCPRTARSPRATTPRPARE